jgi:hypothetical protein
MYSKASQRLTANADAGCELLTWGLHVSPSCVSWLWQLSVLSVGT